MSVVDRRPTKCGPLVLVAEESQPWPRVALGMLLMVLSVSLMIVGFLLQSLGGRPAPLTPRRSRKPGPYGFHEHPAHGHDQLDFERPNEDDLDWAIWEDEPPESRS